MNRLIIYAKDFYIDFFPHEWKWAKNKDSALQKLGQSIHLVGKNDRGFYEKQMQVNDCLFFRRNGILF